jgi:choline dehydrogenase-like flavoprotein
LREETSAAQRLGREARECSRFDYDDDVVVVIGSGAGGGTLANELCQQGIRTVVLEAGPHLSADDYQRQEWPAFNQMAWLDARTTSGSWRLARDFPTLPSWTVKAVGGTSTHWGGACPRFEEYEFNIERTYGGGIDGAGLLDWPIDLSDLAPFYDQAESRMDIHRRSAVSPSLQGGFRFQGDRDGARWSTLIAELPAAARTGRLDLRSDCHAVQVTHDAHGRADAVVYIDGDGALRRQSAKAVCVAGNAIESARLLLLSSSPSHPDGLANSSGQLGCNYMRHVTASVFARLPKPVREYRSEALAGFVSGESGHDPDRGFAGGFYMEPLSLGVPLMAALIDPGAWGPEFTATMAAYEHTAGLWIVGEDMPRQTNRVTLNGEVSDQHGLPVPNVHFDEHRNDVAMREYAWGRAQAIFDAIGAEGGTRTPPYPSTHNLGTCRMSERSQDGVVNGFGQSHDVPNLFVSDGSVFTSSGAANPTLTIVALAIRQAEYLTDEIRSARI